ncbi:uncharacterized protein LOC131885059 [Tigriopus californicus]|uniref:uncharacterized protein LOC131885059 n=1 Tax=Tigriopus californicus TaxID=6832 RepID=UPI0027DA4563|nr:uncharacterized protein LOC131885059 [Tigriopus californicus]
MGLGSSPLKMSTWLTIWVLMLGFGTVELSLTSQNNTRSGKAFSIFQIIRFKNEPCGGSASRNGTCYTSEECASRDGSASGSCAQGFGVCCIFSLGCGGTSSENCTYLQQSGSSNPCTFTICKCSSNICRIRLDFVSFSIAGPSVGTTSVRAFSMNGGAIGDCTTDTFSVTAPESVSSPVICGFNTGQHMILDASDGCHLAAFDFGGTGTTRMFDIKVTQYTCGDENGGPPGCLQYFTGNTGRFASFNFPTSSNSISSTVTHLSNQCYAMCFRQELGKCAICFSPVSVGTAAAIDQGSFGLSIALPGTATKGLQDTGCNADYLQIPGAQRDATPAAEMFVVGSMSPFVHHRICGRFFSFTDAATDEGGIVNTESICTQTRPFRVLFKTDADEMTERITAVVANEQAGFPGGIIGFHLNYALQDC